MKKTTKILIALSLLILNLNINNIVAQNLEMGMYDHDETWWHWPDQYTRSHWSWLDSDGNYHDVTIEPVPWPPYDDNYDDHDGDQGGDYGDEDDWWDQWWNQWLDDPWEFWVWNDDNLTNGGSTSGNIPVKACPKLESRTAKAPNQKRLIIGIGEEVEVRIKNKCGATVKWKITGVGTLTSDPNDQNQVSFQAHWNPGEIHITAYLTGLCSDCGGPISSIELVFQVIQPTGIFFDNSATEPHCPGIYHYKFQPSAGYSADSYLQPATVNFYKVRIREEEAIGLPSGEYFSIPQNIPLHEANILTPCKDLVFPGKGTKVMIADNIYTNFRCRSDRDPNLQGKIEWNIPNLYRDEIGLVDIFFGYTLESGENLGGSSNPVFITSKVNSSNSTNLLDNDHCTTVLNPCN